MIPVTLGNSAIDQVIPAGTREITLSLRLFAVEDIRSARRWLRRLDGQFPIDTTSLFPIGKHSDPSALDEFWYRVSGGDDAGVISEAGMPGMADPGSVIAFGAHQRAIRVIPLTGPSSVTLALAASGMNGQFFTFHGYLPVDPAGRRRAIKELERLSARGQTQIFMETPYRNNRLIEDLITLCQPSTMLCIAADLTLESEFIRTMSIAGWRSNLPRLDKRPALFLLGTGET